MTTFENTVGVLFLGLLANTYLYGVVTYQLILYQTSKFKDILLVKSIVLALFMVDTTHSMVAVYEMWLLCVSNFDHPESPRDISWTISFTGIATSVCAILTQIFLTHRVFMLTKSIFMVALILLISCASMFSCFYAIIRGTIIQDPRALGTIKTFVILWLSLQTVSDLLITVTLIVTLARSRTGHLSTDSIINRLIRFAIQTGIFVSLLSLANLFSFLWLKETNIFAMFAYPLGRVYTNTVLGTLNSRVELRTRAANAREGHKARD